MPSTPVRLWEGLDTQRRAQTVPSMRVYLKPAERYGGIELTLSGLYSGYYLWRMYNSAVFLLSLLTVHTLLFLCRSLFRDELCTDRSLNSDNTNFDVTDLQIMARDSTGADVLFVIECCNDAFDGTRKEESKGDKLYPGKIMETISAGFTRIKADSSPLDYSRRFAANLREFRVPHSVRERSTAIEENEDDEEFPYAPGQYRRHCGKGDDSIVLQPL